MNLTKREKILLSILAIIIGVTVYVVFLFLPLWRNFSANQTELELQKELHQSMEITAKRYGTNDQALKEAKIAAEEKLGTILPLQENDKIYENLILLAEATGNKIINSMITDHEIFVVSPELPEVEEVDPETPTSYTLKDALYLVNGIQMPEVYNPIINNVSLDSNTIEIEMTGTPETMGAFLDAVIAENKSMKTIGIGRNDQEDTYIVTIKVYSTQGME